MVSQWSNADQLDSVPAPVSYTDIDPSDDSRHPTRPDDEYDVLLIIYSR